VCVFYVTCDQNFLSLQSFTLQNFEVQAMSSSQ